MKKKIDFAEYEPKFFGGFIQYGIAYPSDSEQVVNFTFDTREPGKLLSVDDWRYAQAIIEYVFKEPDGEPDLSGSGYSAVNESTLEQLKNKR